MREFFMKDNLKKKWNRVFDQKRRKGDKFYFTQKVHDNSFNSWIDKKRFCYIKWEIIHNQ